MEARTHVHTSIFRRNSRRVTVREEKITSSCRFSLVFISMSNLWK